MNKDLIEALSKCTSEEETADILLEAFAQRTTKKTQELFAEFNKAYVALTAFLDYLDGKRK